MNVNPFSASKGNDKMANNPPTIELILQEVPTPGVSKREVPILAGGKGFGVEVPATVLTEVTTWMVGQLENQFCEINSTFSCTFFALYVYILTCAFPLLVLQGVETWQRD